MKYARINSDGSYNETIANSESIAAIMIRDGFLPFECEDEPDGSDLSPIESYTQKMRREGDIIVGYYEKNDADPEKVEAEIVRLKAELSATDYMVVKNQELQMSGQELEYDPDELHNTRQPLREAIRELESYLV